MSKPRKGFRSAAEMGRAFEAQDVTEENSTPTTILVDKRYDPTLTMRIPVDDLRRLKALADARRVPTATMGRMLLLERLHEEEAPRRPAMHLLEALLADETLLTVLRRVLRSDSPKALEKARRMLQSASQHPVRAPAGHVNTLPERGTRGRLPGGAARCGARMALRRRRRRLRDAGPHGRRLRPPGTR